MVSVVSTNITCLRENCYRLINRPMSATCGYHCRRLRHDGRDGHEDDGDDHGNHSQLVLCVNVLPSENHNGDVSYVQFENETDLHLPEWQVFSHTTQAQVIMWKLPCHQRTQLSFTNKNHQHQLTPGEHRRVRKYRTRERVWVTFSSEKGHLFLPLLKGYMYMTVCVPENRLSGVTSTDPRREYITVYARRVLDVMKMIRRVYTHCERVPRVFHEHYTPPDMNIIPQHRFTDHQKKIQNMFLAREGVETSLYIFSGFGSRFGESTHRRSCHSMKYKMYDIFVSATQTWHRMSVDEYIGIRDLGTVDHRCRDLSTLSSVVHPVFVGLFLKKQ